VIVVPDTDPPAPGRPAGEPASPAEVIAAAVLAHPEVARLHGGPFGTVATYLPRRRVTGVRLGEHDDWAELAVVLRAGRPLPVVADELRAAVRTVAGPIQVDVIIADLQLDDGQLDDGQLDDGQLDGPAAGGSSVIATVR
jgi:hypothetical protein